MQTLAPRKRFMLAAILLVASFIGLMSQTMMVTALPVITRQMHQPLAIVQWLTTGYTLVVGIITPLSANLFEKFRNRPFFLTIIGSFILATFVGGIANSFWLVLFARLVQAAAGGLLISFQMITLVMIYPPEKRGTIMGISSLVVSFGPAIGPTLAGFLLSLYGWRSLFWSVMPFMIIVWLIGLVVVPNFTKPQNIKFDFVSVFEMLIGLTLIMGSLSFISTSPLISLIALLIGIVLTAIFYRRQLHLTSPLLNVKLFSIRSFSLTIIVGTLLYMTLLGTEQLFSVFSQNTLHTTSMMAGLILFPGAIVNALGGAVAGPLYDKYGVKWIVLTGIMISVVATIPTLFISNHIPVWLLSLLYTVRFLGLGISFAPLISESYRDMAAKDISQATAINNCIRQLAGAFSITILVIISEIPATAVNGMRLAMWVTFLFGIIALAYFVSYLNRRK